MANSMVIDMHAHVLVPEVEALVAGTEGRRNELATQAAWAGPESSAHNRSLGAGYAPKLTDITTRLADMDAMGVEMQAICTSPTQYYYWADPGVAGRIVAAANQHLASLVEAHPTRFVGLAAVSLQHPSLAIEQLTHAVRSLGLRGVEIATRVGDRELSDETFDPFWAAAESLAAVVFIHPISCTLGERLDRYYLSNVVGNPVETTAALSHLIFSGTLERHPGLRIVAAHGGGYLPSYSARSDHAYAVRPESHTISRPPSEFLKQIWFDSLVYAPEALRYLIQQVGTSQVVLGSDYPFDMGVTDPLERVMAAGLSPADRDAVLGGNAARLLGLDEGRMRE